MSNDRIAIECNHWGNRVPDLHRTVHFQGCITSCICIIKSQNVGTRYDRIYFTLGKDRARAIYYICPSRIIIVVCSSALVGNHRIPIQADHRCRGISHQNRSGYLYRGIASRIGIIISQRVSSGGGYINLASSKYYSSAIHGIGSGGILILVR